MDFNELEKKRTMHYTYYNLDEMEVGLIPYNAIVKALQYELFTRKHPYSDHWSDDLTLGRCSSVLIHYPKYIDILYEFAMGGRSYKEYFLNYPPQIIQTFEYLFPDVVRRLDKLVVSNAKLNKGIFEEINIKKLN